MDHAFRRDALEAGNDQRFAGLQLALHVGGVDVLDPAAGVGAPGVDARLAAGDGNGGDVDFVEGHRDQRDRLLLAGGKEHVHLALGRVFAEFLGHFDQAVGDAGHRGNDGDHLVAGVAGALEARGDVAHAVDGADGGAAVFLDDEGHGLGAAGSEGKGPGLGKPGVGHGEIINHQSFNHPSECGGKSQDEPYGSTASRTKILPELIGKSRQKRPLPSDCSTTPVAGQVLKSVLVWTS